jgi:glycosyltransferase involved in cell wall biosynthesis
MNSASVLSDCLDSIRGQTWKNIETLVVDAFSADRTVQLAEKYGAKVVRYGPRQDAPFQRLFGAPYQWNHGAALAEGDYLYMLGSDIRLSPTVIEDCVNLAEKEEYDALVIPELSYGEGFWTKCKSLQRSFFVGDRSMESPMFIKMKAWKELNGLDPRVEGYMDWDLTDRLAERRLKIGRVRSWAYHYEGKLQLSKLLRKKYVYGKATNRYFAKHGRRFLAKEIFSRFSLLRPSYVRNLPKMLANPKLGAGFLLMTMSEYMSAAFGALSAMADKSDEVEIRCESL